MSTHRKVMSLRQRARRLVSNRDGYALTLTLVVMPLIIGTAAFIIDAARVTNLHTDLQDAVDAMALAGARELDGRDNAIPRARAAIAAMVGNPAAFSEGGAGGNGAGMGNVENIVFTANAANDVVVTFMAGIPASDNDPINNNCVNPRGRSVSCDVVASNPGDLVAASNAAKFVRVTSVVKNVSTIFALPGLGRDNVAVRAEAVATYTAAACDVTPIFICNPFENMAQPNFHQQFKDGNLYARQFIMSLRGASTAGPGNFGFLSIADNGAAALRVALATGNTGSCHSADQLETEPGGNIGPAEQGLGTRFGIYAGPMNGSSNDPLYRPARNVRMGQDTRANGSTQSCSRYEPETNILQAMPFPPGNGAPTWIGGGSMSSNAWDLNRYWQVSHGNLAAPPTGPAPAAPGAVVTYRPSLPATSTTTITNPSRYDVYRYEIVNNLVGDRAPGGERGSTQHSCYGGPALTGFPDDVLNDRRTIFSAIVNCVEHQDDLNGRVEIQPEAFARMFLTKPMITDGSNKYISLEVVDVTGAGGMGTVENFLREEAELVR